jgi:hypothetical protein
MMKQFAKSSITASVAAALSMVAGSLAAHDEDDAGTPVCTEANYMMADAMNAPFAAANGAGAVIEMNIFTGTPGITVPGPFTPANVGTDICPPEVVCDLPGGPFGGGSP